MRFTEVERKTKETEIKMVMNADGKGKFTGSSGIGFFDHMLNSFCTHSGFDIDLECAGDLNVDCHHTVEDIGIVFGKGIFAIIGDRKGLNRFGNEFIPMDESLAQVTVDICGRPYLVFNAEFSCPAVGEFDTELVKEFYYAVAMNACIDIHVNLLYGDNSHHQIEAIFKAFARALKQAVKKSDSDNVLSSKGVLY